MTHIRLSIGPGSVGCTFPTLAILVVVVTLTSDDKLPMFCTLFYWTEPCLSAGGSVQKVQKWMLCVTKRWASHNRCMSLRHPVETPPPHHGKARVLSFDWQNPWETKYFLWEWMVCLAINITPVQPKRHRRKSHCSTIQPVIPLCMSGNLQATLVFHRLALGSSI